MIIKLLTYSGLLLSGIPKSEFSSTKKNYNLQGLVNVHHIIPQQLRNHPTIRFSNYKIN